MEEVFMWESRCFRRFTFAIRQLYFILSEQYPTLPGCIGCSSANLRWFDFRTFLRRKHPRDTYDLAISSLYPLWPFFYRSCSEFMKIFLAEIFFDARVRRCSNLKPLFDSVKLRVSPFKSHWWFFFRSFLHELANGCSLKRGLDATDVKKIEKKIVV